MTAPFGRSHLSWEACPAPSLSSQCMASTEAATRRDGASQRPADPRADLTGRPRSATADGADPGRLRTEAGAGARAGRRGCRSARAAETGRGACGAAAGAAAAAGGAAAVRGPAGVAAIGATLVATAALRRRAGSSPCARGWRRRSALVPAMVALLDRDLAAYHGVEHKAIAAYEQGIDDPAGCPRSTTAAAPTCSRR